MAKLPTVTFAHYAAAGFPLVAISTADEDRTIRSILGQFPDKPVWRIAKTGGLIDLRTRKLVDEGQTTGYSAALAKIRTVKDGAILVMLDSQYVMKEHYRAVLDALPEIKKTSSRVFMLAPSWALPAEMEGRVKIVRDNLPTREELETILTSFVKDLKKQGHDLPEIDNEAVVNNMLGLTLEMAENSAALSFVVSESTIDHNLILAEKTALLRESGLIELIEPADIGDLGGLSVLQCAIDHDVIANMKDPDIAVRGMIVDGIPGTGKTESFRVLAAKMRLPILRISVAQLMDKHVGESERKLYAVFRIARAFPCILLFDEAEKVFGNAEKNGDSGVSSRLLSIMLTQMDDFKNEKLPVFIGMTTNNYKLLPAALTRRVELKFFVDLPSYIERVEIARIKLGKFGKSLVSFAEFVAENTANFSGMEITDAIQAAMRLSKRNLTVEALSTAIQGIKPMSKTQAQYVQELRQWGIANLTVANTPEAVIPESTTARKIGKF
jgi:SpoVK/Ycf46/Vps4 family AAA+-type ATPase